LLFYLTLNQIEANLLVPNVMGSQTRLSPLLVIVAVSAGAGIGGILGAIIAIPIVAVLRVLFVEVVAPALREWTGANERPRSVRGATAEDAKHKGDGYRSSTQARSSVNIISDEGVY